MKTFALLFAFSYLTEVNAQDQCNTSSTIEITTCENYVLPSGNQTLYSSGKYHDIIPNIAGCDSLIKINLTVNEPINVQCTHLNEIENNCYRVLFEISGGNPSGEGGTYLLSGDYAGLVVPKQTISSACIDINETFKVHIEDGNGCAMSFTDNPLPIFLISFSVEAQANGNLLKWMTASEISNESFLIERSTNGFDFDKIATIKGSGTTNSLSSYSYLDQFNEFGLAYYKLIKVDFDGTKVNVGFIEANRNEPIFEYQNIYPNPTTQVLNVAFEMIFDCQK